MAKILVMPDGNWLSHVSRPLEIALVLRELGHEVEFAGEGAYMKLPREKGFRISPAASLAPGNVLKCSRSGRVNWWDDRRLARSYQEDLRVFEETKPDLVLADFRLSLSTSCDVAEIPLVVTLNAAWTDYYSVRTRAPEHLAATRILGRPLANFLAPVLKATIVNVDARPFRRLRKKLGLEPRGSIWDVWRGDLNLMVDTPEYAPTEGLPGSFHYIGPIVWEPDLNAPHWLEELDPDRRTIYFTMGSTGYPRFFEQAIEIFGGTDYQCVMTTAGMVTFDSIPSNFHVVDFAPGSMILEKSDVVVCQGGNGTIYQAMSQGVPIIGIPTMHDQEFNLDRVVDLGIGIHLSELRFRPQHLLEAVESVFGDARFEAAAQRQRSLLEAYDGPRTGARLIDDFLAV